MESTLSGKNHVNMIAPKLSRVCYIVELNHIYCRMSLRRFIVLLFTQYVLLADSLGKFDTWLLHLQITKKNH